MSSDERSGAPGRRILVPAPVVRATIDLLHDMLSLEAPPDPQTKAALLAAAERTLRALTEARAAQRRNDGGSVPGVPADEG